MAISTAREAGDVTVVTVEGQLIVANRQELKQVIQDALDGGARKFVVDFGPTAYIDSSGLGALVSINRKVREQGGELRLAGLNEDLRSLFELTKLDTLFLIADSATQALERF
jgi:anti-sigma B factor antagonist